MNDRGHQEIIIIKRGNEEEEGHHGGAWKIAFADFMTAMMALFLVLWLINAANEETKRAVASYFNPIKLVDRNRSAKGLEEQKGGAINSDLSDTAEDPKQEQQKVSHAEKPTDLDTSSEKRPSNTHTDESFFADPLTALDQIEASALEKSGISNELESSPDRTKPDEFTDPFKEGHATYKAEPSKLEFNGLTKREPHKQATEPITPVAGKMKGVLDSGAIKLENKITEEIEKNLGENALVKGAIQIKQTDNGILIQITDLPTSPMFDIGKAVPNGETVIAISAVAKALGQTSGKIRIHGHTDGRKFGNIGNGNWRLSADRAQSVYLMLLRAGLADSRISEITGFADRKPIVPNNPMDGQNRRIEILLESK